MEDAFVLRFYASVVVFALMMSCTAVFANEQVARRVDDHPFDSDAAVHDEIADASVARENVDNADIARRLHVMQESLDHLHDELALMREKQVEEDIMAEIDMALTNSAVGSTLGRTRAYIADNAIALASLAVSAAGLYAGYYFNSQMLKISMAQLCLSQGAAALSCMNELARGSYGAYVKHVQHCQTHDCTV